MSTNLGFLDLPREVRDIIYSYLLLRSTPKRRLELRKCTQPEIDTHRLDLSLLRINKQLSAESLEFFYGENHFDFEATELIFKAVTDAQISLIKDARFLWSHDVSPFLAQQWKIRMNRIWEKKEHAAGVKLDVNYHGGLWIRGVRARKNKGNLGGGTENRPMFGMIQMTISSNTSRFVGRSSTQRARGTLSANSFHTFRGGAGL